MNRQILSNIIQRALTDKSFRRRLSSGPQAVLADFDLSDGDIQLVQQALAAEPSGPGTMQLEQRISRSRLPMGIFFGFLDDHAHSDEGSDELILNEDDHTQQTDESAQIAGGRAEGEINFEKPQVRLEGTDGSRGPDGAPIHLPDGKANGDPGLPGGKYADGLGGESGPLNGDGRDDDFGAPKGFGLPSGGGSIVDPGDLDYNKIGSTAGDQALVTDNAAVEVDLAVSEIQADAGSAPLNAKQQADVIG